MRQAPKAKCLAAGGIHKRLVLVGHFLVPLDPMVEHDDYCFFRLFGQFGSLRQLPALCLDVTGQVRTRTWPQNPLTSSIFEPSLKRLKRKS